MDAMRTKPATQFAFLIEPLVLFVAGALAYLPFAGQFGYYNDDWYSMYAARLGGPGVFKAIFSIDRPGRAYLMAPLYSLFGGHPLYYSLSLLVFRVLGAFSLLWLLRMLWPKNRKETFLAAALFLVYPGFLSEPIAIDFQSHIVGIFLGLLSLALTVKALLVQDNRSRTLLWTGAVLSGWGYLSQMEYYIGFELVRIALITLLVLRRKQAVRATSREVFVKSLPYLVIPLLFLAWRLLLFQNERSTTDVGLQLGRFSGSPLYIVVWWVMYLLQDFFNVLLVGWTLPLSQLGFAESLSLTIKVLAVAFAAALVLMLETLWTESPRPGPEDTPENWPAESAGLGVVWILAGLAPVILANRHITFSPDYSRYSLVSSAGAVLLLVAMSSRLTLRPLRWMLIGFLFLSGILTHLANGSAYAHAFSDIKSFWWQVSWRIPDMEKGTTIVAHYPNGGIRENSFVWGPANQIYYAGEVGRTGAAITNVSALLLDDEAVLKIITRQPQYLDPYRGVEAYPNPRNILVITQPGPRSCVQVIDGQAPEYSHNENDSIMLVGPYSETQHIIPGASSKIPPDYLFGPEPGHSWCYFYEKASLARQRGNWDEVLQLGNQALVQGLGPGDSIEWMPFLQAYAISGDEVRLKDIAPSVMADPFIAQQACHILGGMQNLSPSMALLIQTLYCPNGGG
jgi:hypothetical protein